MGEGYTPPPMPFRYMEASVPDEHAVYYDVSALGSRSMRHELMRRYFNRPHLQVHYERPVSPDVADIMEFIEATAANKPVHFARTSFRDIVQLLLNEGASIYMERAATFSVPDKVLLCERNFNASTADKIIPQIIDGWDEPIEGFDDEELAVTFSRECARAIVTELMFEGGLIVRDSHKKN